MWVVGKYVVRRQRIILKHEVRARNVIKHDCHLTKMRYLGHNTKLKTIYESQTRSELLKVKRNQILLIFLLCTRSIYTKRHFKMKKKHMKFLSGEFNVLRRMYRVEQKDYHFGDMPQSHDIMVTPRNWCWRDANVAVLVQFCCFDVLTGWWAW